MNQVASTELHIKNMVCNRCIRFVREELTDLGFNVDSVELGKAILQKELSAGDTEKIRQVLKENGFELIDDKKSWIINNIKTLIIEYIHYDREKPDFVNLSDYLARELGYDYSYLSHLYSSVEGQTIEHYVILQKVEKVKELLVYDELSLNEISYQLGYSSPQHLSQQFKKVTGLTPSHFKKIKENKRNPLDQI
jgi:AraC family transcriptional regulator